MKHLLTLSVVLALAVSANAALLSDNFNDQNWTANPTWTVLKDEAPGSYGAMTIFDQGGGDYCLYKLNFDTSIWLAEAALSSPQSGDQLVLTAQIECDGDWRPLSFALVDAAGKGIFLDSYGGDSYVAIGAGGTTDNGETHVDRSVVDAAVDPNTEGTLKYVVTGLTTNTASVQGYYDGTAYGGAVAVDITGVGDITHAVINSAKKWYIDDIDVDIPEPASLVLLGLGGLGVLIRRR